MAGRFLHFIEPGPTMPFPGKCVSCGAPDKPMIDLGLQMRGYGVMLLCKPCLKAASALLEDKTKNPQFEDLKTENKVLKETLANVRTGITDLARVVHPGNITKSFDVAVATRVEDDSEPDPNREPVVSVAREGADFSF